MSKPLCCEGDVPFNSNISSSTAKTFTPENRDSRPFPFLVSVNVTCCGIQLDFPGRTTQRMLQFNFCYVL